MTSRIVSDVMVTRATAIMACRNSRPSRKPHESRVFALSCFPIVTSERDSREEFLAAVLACCSAQERLFVCKTFFHRRISKARARTESRSKARESVKVIRGLGYAATPSRASRGSALGLPREDSRCDQRNTSDLRSGARRALVHRKMLGDARRGVRDRTYADAPANSAAGVGLRGCSACAAVFARSSFAESGEPEFRQG